ncbi:Holliday junction ATP-dependent DNA helicase RuvB [candidate division SR1 bacterium]|nr:Holliday junction ATP-dependent DNA helicase RuvB [candidate division SR1 bacterium]
MFFIYKGLHFLIILKKTKKSRGKFLENKREKYTLLFMEVKKIDLTQKISLKAGARPENFDEFVGQKQIKKMLTTAIHSAQKREGPLGHILFSGASGYGKTTLSHIIAQQLGVQIKVVTAYAISKPSELVSILNSLEEGNLLFIDEIHRLKPTIEEVLYIAMEDFVIDMVMPEGGSVRIPLNPFTLVGATTKMEQLSTPLKNRFVYSFHFADYTKEEKESIIQRYLDEYQISLADDKILTEIEKKVDSVPREIHNLCVKIRDYCVSRGLDTVNEAIWSDFLAHAQLQEGGMTTLHQQYLDILAYYDRPLGAKVIAAQMNVSEKALESDIEPLLLKLGKIERTPAGRVLLGD